MRDKTPWYKVWSDKDAEFARLLRGDDEHPLYNRFKEETVSQNEKDVKMRRATTGATRDQSTNKLEYRRFFSSAVLKARAEYMNKHRVQADGAVREPDNWKNGMPRKWYADSLVRHVEELKLAIEPAHPDYWVDVEIVSSGGTTTNIIDNLAAIMFNAEGLMYELLRDRSIREDQ